MELYICRNRIEILIIGDGPLRDQLEAQAVDLNIADAIRFTGEVSRAEVYRELSRRPIHNSITCRGVLCRRRRSDGSRPPCSRERYRRAP